MPPIPQKPPPPSSNAFSKKKKSSADEITGKIDHHPGHRRPRISGRDSSFISDLEVFQKFEAIAKKRKIPYQRSVLPRGGTDSGGMQRAGAGSHVFTLSCPTRNIHTVTEAVNRQDLNACRDLLAAYLEETG